MAGNSEEQKENINILILERLDKIIGLIESEKDQYVVDDQHNSRFKVFQRISRTLDFIERKRKEYISQPDIVSLLTRIKDMLLFERKQDDIQLDCIRTSPLPSRDWAKIPEL